eukprot:EG_transcript_28958
MNMYHEWLRHGEWAVAKNKCHLGQAALGVYPPSHLLWMTAISDVERKEFDDVPDPARCLRLAILDEAASPLLCAVARRCRHGRVPVLLFTAHPRLPGLPADPPGLPARPAAGFRLTFTPHVVPAWLAGEPPAAAMEVTDALRRMDELVCLTMEELRRAEATPAHWKPLPSWEADAVVADLLPAQPTGHLWVAPAPRPASPGPAAAVARLLHCLRCWGRSGAQEDLE